MHTIRSMLITGAILALSLVGVAVAQERPGAVVRIAELKIDPARLEEYKAIVKEEMAISVRDEPGVIAIYAVSEKEDASRLRFFEIYADEESYRSHIASPHFRKYFEATKDMIVDRRLIDTVPVQLSTKSR
jgi:quinol monooxygenase YgiN